MPLSPREDLLRVYQLYCFFQTQFKCEEIVETVFYRFFALCIILSALICSFYCEMLAILLCQ